MEEIVGESFAGTAAIVGPPSKLLNKEREHAANVERESNCNGSLSTIRIDYRFKRLNEKLALAYERRQKISMHSRPKILWK